MNDIYESIRQSLCAATHNYQAIVNSGRLQPHAWLENVKLLQPIVRQLQEVAKERINQSQIQLDENVRAQNHALEERAEQYYQMEQEKHLLSPLDADIIGLVTNITKIGEEIDERHNKIREYQEKIRQSASEKQKWDTVFWATCWIPFVGIGTGCKRGAVTAEYLVKVQELGHEIEKLKERAAYLNTELKNAQQQKDEEGSRSADITRQITAINGRLSQLTTLINDLSSQNSLWRVILRTCDEIDVLLKHTSGKLEEVTRCFNELLKVEQLLHAPSTDRFIAGRVCRGASLGVGETLGQDQYLMSPNRKYIAVLSTNNELVVYNSEEALWSSGSQGASGDGLLYLDGQGPVTMMGTGLDWDTKRPGAVSLVMQDDGNLVAYDSEGNSLWASDTFTYADVDSVCFQAPAQ